MQAGKVTGIPIRVAMAENKISVHVFKCLNVLGH